MAGCVSAGGAFGAANPRTRGLGWARRTGTNGHTSLRAGAQSKGGGGGAVGGFRRGRRGLSCRAAGARELPDSQRVVITGAGVVSTAGHDREAFFETLLQGKRTVL